MSTDTLSDVLRAVRLTGAVFFAVDASAPWVAEAPAARELGPYIMPGVEHVIEYHVDHGRLVLGRHRRRDARFASRPATSSSFRRATRT